MTVCEQHAELLSDVKVIRQIVESGNTSQKEAWKKIDAINLSLNGNGKPGLLTRQALTEQAIKAHADELTRIADLAEKAADVQRDRFWKILASSVAAGALLVAIINAILTHAGK
jgi:hypothetical protein